MEMLQRRAERDRRAREKAEQLLEEKARELHEAQEKLRLATRGRLEGLSRASEELSQVQDLDLLFLQIVSEARALTGAEAGSLYRRVGQDLVFEVSQNDLLDPMRNAMLRHLSSVGKVGMNMNSISGAVALTGVAINIPDAYKLSTELPYQFSHRFDEATGYHTRAMLTLPLKGQGGELFGVLQLINPVSTPLHPGLVFDQDDEVLMRHFAGLASISIERTALTRSILTRMIRSVELRDPYEGMDHAKRVANISVDLYQAWANAKNIHPKELQRSADQLRIAAMLHDIGKLGIPDAILRKPAALSAEEMRHLRQHVIMGAKLFDEAQTNFDKHARDVALYHHARWDGAGYPTIADLEQLRIEAPLAAGPVLEPRGEAIPLFARIVALADVFVALISERYYKNAWSIADALKTIQTESGRQFDPELTALFPEVIRQYELRLRQAVT